MWLQPALSREEQPVAAHRWPFHRSAVTCDTQSRTIFLLELGQSTNQGCICFPKEVLKQFLSLWSQSTEQLLLFHFLPLHFLSLLDVGSQKLQVLVPVPVVPGDSSAARAAPGPDLWCHCLPFHSPTLTPDHAPCHQLCCHHSARQPLRSCY